MISLTPRRKLLLLSCYSTSQGFTGFKFRFAFCSTCRFHHLLGKIKYLALSKSDSHFPSSAQSVIETILHSVTFIHTTPWAQRHLEYLLSSQRWCQLWSNGQRLGQLMYCFLICVRSIDSHQKSPGSNYTKYERPQTRSRYFTHDGWCACFDRETKEYAYIIWPFRSKLCASGCTKWKCRINLVQIGNLWFFLFWRATCRLVEKRNNVYTFENGMCGLQEIHGMREGIRRKF